jgi:hypothetical protein
MIPKSGHRFSEKIMLKQRARDGNSKKRHDALMPQPRPGPMLSRLAWFVGLWLAGVLVTAAVAYGLRLWLL